MKAKKVYDGRLIFDMEEIEKQHRFARLFNLTVYLACVDLERDGHHRWVPLSDLMGSKEEWRGKRRVATVEVNTAYGVDTNQLSLLGVMMQYSFHALDMA